LNYLAHGYRFLSRPYVLAGTALPDWLAAGDRGARLRPGPAPADSDPVAADLAFGIARHVEDDRRFHRSEAFQRTEADIVALLREAHADPAQRAWFLGHVLCEMLVDAWLIRESPARLDAYYDALDGVDALRVAAAAAPWLTRPAPGLPGTIAAFREWRYLYGYADDAGLFERLRGVARRVGLMAPAPPLFDVLPAARRLVYERAPSLLRVDSPA
jgi:hypothetical protein